MEKEGQRDDPLNYMLEEGAAIVYTDLVILSTYENVMHLKTYFFISRLLSTDQMQNTSKVAIKSTTKTKLASRQVMKSNEKPTLVVRPGIETSIFTLGGAGCFIIMTFTQSFPLT